MFKRNGVSQRVKYFISFPFAFLALIYTTYNVRSTYGALDVSRDASSSVSRWLKK